MNDRIDLSRVKSSGWRGTVALLLYSLIVLALVWVVATHG